MVTQLPNIDVAASTSGSGKSAKTGIRDYATRSQEPDPGYSDKGKRGRKEPKVQKDKHVPVISRNIIGGEVDTFKLRLHVPKDVQQDHNGGKVDLATVYMTADGLHYEYNGKNYRLVAVNSEGVTQAKNNANKLSDDKTEDTQSAANTPLSGRGTSTPGSSDPTSVPRGAVSMADRVSMARAAGFSPSDAITMGAISQAESAGNSNAYNPNVNTGDNSYGLYQINMLGSMGVERNALFKNKIPGYTGYESLKDPWINTQAAKIIYDQQGLGAWSTYKNGAYSKFMNNAQNGIGAGSDTAGMPSGGGADGSTPESQRQTCLPTENSNSKGGSSGSGQGSGGDGSTPSSGSTPASGTLKQNQQEAYDAARHAGLSDSAAKILVANMSGESLANPADKHWDVKHYSQGIVQWEDRRAELIRDQFGSYPKDMSVAQQTNAAIWEMKTYYPGAWSALNNESLSANDRMYTLVSKYEISANWNGDTATRMGYYNGLNLTPVSGISGATTSSADITPDLVLASLNIDNLTSLDNINNVSASEIDPTFGDVRMMAEVSLPPISVNGAVTTPSSSSAPSTPSNLASNGKTDTNGGNAPPIPPLPNDLSQLMQGLDKGGLHEQVQKLTKLTGDLNQITTTIAQLLPGAPYSFIGIAAQLVKNLGTIQNGLSGILGQMDPSVQSILKNIQTLPDMSNMMGQVQQVMSGLKLDQFMKLLPPNLSVDKLMTGLAGMDPTMLSGIANGMGGSNNQGAFNQLQTLMDSLSSNTPSNTTQPTPTPQYSVAPLPPTRPPDLNIINNVPLPPTRPSNFGVSIQDEIVAASYSVDAETVDVSDESSTKRLLEEILAREITDDQWNSLLWASAINAGDSSQEVAWFVKTILNRCRKTGKNINDILKDFGDFESLRPIDSLKATEICKSITDNIFGVPDNNYYFDKLTEDEISTGTILKKKRGRSLGIQIGRNVVYPGAKWP